MPDIASAQGLYPVVHFSFVQGGASSAVHLLLTLQKTVPSYHILPGQISTLTHYGMSSGGLFITGSVA